MDWFVLGVFASVLAGFVAAGAVGRLLRTRRAIAWFLIAAIGIVLSATLTPIHDVLETGDAGVGVCDLSRFGPAPLDALGTLNDTSLNILLFIPPGSAVGLLPSQRSKLVIALGAMAMPFAIEGIQLLAIPLHRGCQSADVADNLTGLVLGVIIGLTVSRMAGSRLERS